MRTRACSNEHDRVICARPSGMVDDRLSVYMFLIYDQNHRIGLQFSLCFTLKLWLYYELLGPLILS